jgi:Fe-S cluster assembly protein SufD
MSPVVEQLDPLTVDFEEFRRDPAFGAGALGRAREAGLARFRALGFPTTRLEEWKHTSLAPLAEAPFGRVWGEDVPRQALEPFLFGDSVPAQVVVVNGRVSKSLGFGAVPAGVTIETGASERAIGNVVDIEANPYPFAALNQAFFEDAVVIRVAAHAVVNEPVHVLFVAAPGGKRTGCAPRLFVEAGAQSQIKIIETYAGVGDGVSLTNAVSEFALESGAVIDHVKIQRESLESFHLAGTFVRLKRSSTFSSQAITFGGRIARNDIHAVLDGEGAECTLNGLYLADGHSLVDTHSTIDHAKPHCPSHEVYKGILAGKSRAVFNGKIIVRQDAQKTDAKQTNKAMLLSGDATINTKPQLEIFADDVKCTHGAAIGQLDEDQLFYLRARGLAEVDARSVLIHAFAGQVVDGIKIDAVRERVMQVMEDKLQLAHQV